MDYRITQCPRCGTSFRVTEAHLAVAAGAVRCGSCLHIFNARDHWQQEQPAEPEPVADTGNLDDNLADTDFLIDDGPAIDLDPLIDDDILIDDDSPLFTEGEDEAHPPLEPAGDKFAPSFLDTGWQPDLRNDFGAGEGFGEDGGDESWAEQLLEEDPFDPLDTPPGIDERFSQFDDILAQVPEVPEEAAEILTGGRGGGLDISPEFLELASADFRPGEAVPGAAAPAVPHEAEPVQPEPLHADEPFGGAGPRAGSPDRNSRILLGGFEPEPLQLRQFVREPRWPRVLWGLGLIAALALLVFQYVYFNFDRLARSESRGWLGQLCTMAGCRLPAQHDLAAIHTSSLIVRSHPTSRGALAIDAILTNTAGFSQPYPNLLLQFTDLDGEPVAGRVFTAEEYLGGELSGTRLMPVQQPIHIGLTVADPGPRAVNYQLQVTGG